MLMEVVSFSLVAFSAVFFIVDPVAVVPIFVTMTEHDTPQKRRDMAKRACLILGGVLTFFALGGGVLFKLLGVTLAAFKIAGGILLLLTSLDMLRSKASQTRTSPEEIAEGAAKDDIAIVPLAMPLLAGPGSIATVMMLTAQVEHTWQVIPVILSIWLTAFISWLMLRSSELVNRFLGKSGRAILDRVMGLLLAAIAVQFMIAGVSDALPEILSKLPVRS